MMKTHTRVHSMETRRQERALGSAACIRTMVAMMTGAQLLLWVVFFGYDKSVQAVWQSALMLIVPMLTLYFLWKDAPGNAKLSLLLLPCLTADAAFLQFALGGYIRQLIPVYPHWVGTAAVAAVTLLIALTAKPEGTARGAYVMKGLILVLFVFGTVFLRASNRADRLWPLMGRGMMNQLKTALSGSGCVWTTALLFLNKSKKAAKYAVFPWAAGCIWALWFGFLRPWAAGDVMTAAEKMMGLSRHAHSIMLYEIAGLLWMLLLPLALCAALSSAEMLTKAAFPKIPRIVPMLAVLLPGCAGMLLMQERLLVILEKALPWRYVLCLLTGILIRFIGRKKH